MNPTTTTILFLKKYKTKRDLQLTTNAKTHGWFFCCATQINKIREIKKIFKIR